MSEQPQKTVSASFSWAKAFTIVAVLAILVGGSIIWHLILSVNPTAMLMPTLKEERTRGLFASYIGGLDGQNNLQVASLKTKEEFAYVSEKKLFRYMPGGVVEVAARVPCEITYNVPLRDSEWSFHIRDQGRRMIVIAPPIQFNRPAVDLARYDLRVVKDSMIRDSEEVKLALQNEIPSLLEEVGRKNIDSIRDTARISIKDFLEQWLLKTLEDEQLITPVVDRVYFADEEHLFKQRIFAEETPGARQY